LHTPEQWLVFCERHMQEAADMLGVEVPEESRS
jgi:hypothetical protein